MRRGPVRTRWLGVALLAFVGCNMADWWRRPDNNIKPPLHEEYVLPPSDDPRFSSPPVLPKEALNMGAPKKDPTKPVDQIRGPGGFGAGAGGMGPNNY